MQPTGAARRLAIGAVAILVIVLAVLGLAIPMSAGAPGGATAPADQFADDAVYSINLPYEEPPRVPAGPNREEFTAQCRLCHSPRMVLTQPRFPEKTWATVVHKMVATYGAQLTPDEEKNIVAYLVTVRGPEPAAPPTR
ncbi:MAG TPA: hypothetical protein VGF55_02905 [Gemmataceae bacterium]|jgi:cytochrome c5